MQRADSKLKSKDQGGDKSVAEPSGRFTSADVHRALFPKRAPKAWTLEEM
jgi:hypothetical protein